MATSITLSQQISSDTKKTRSITNINPAATDKQIVSLATALNDLTTNTLNGINRVDKTEIDPDITYYDVKLTVETPDQYITFNDTTNTVTINAASMSEGEASIGLVMNIVDGGATVRITNPPTIIDWTFGRNSEFAVYPMDLSGVPILGISFIKSATSISDTFTMTLAGGVFTSGAETYHYSPLTITVVINV